MAFETRKVAASAAKTSSGATAGVAVSSATTTLGVDVTAFAGTSPTVNFAVEWSFDNVNWGAGESPITFAQMTGAKSSHVTVQTRAPFVRLVWTIGGTTPSFTFAVYTFSF